MVVGGDVQTTWCRLTVVECLFERVAGAGDDGICRMRFVSHCNFQREGFETLH